MALCPDECGTSASGYVRPALTCAVATDNSGRCPVNFQKVASVNYDPCTGDFSFGVSLPCCCTTCNGGGAQIPASLGGNIQGSGPGCIHNISGVVGPGCSSAGDSCDSNATNCGGGTCGVNCPGSCLDDCGCVFCVTDCFFGGTECFDTCGGKGVNVQATITFSLTVTPPPPGQGKHWS
jgi:hypothetical protein